MDDGNWRYDPNYYLIASFEALASLFLTNTVRMSTLDYTTETGAIPFSTNIDSINKDANIVGSKVNGASIYITDCVNSTVNNIIVSAGYVRRSIRVYNSSIVNLTFENKSVNIVAFESTL